MTLPRPQQLAALMVLIAAIVIVGETPVIVAGAIGKTLPDPLIAMSDKTVTGLVGVLGTIAGLVFRSSPADDQRVDNTTKALDAIAVAQASTPPQPPLTPPVQQVSVVNTPNDPIPVQPQNEGN